MMELQLCRHILLTKWDDCEIFDEYDNLRKKFQSGGKLFSVTTHHATISDSKSVNPRWKNDMSIDEEDISRWSRYSTGKTKTWDWTCFDETNEKVFAMNHVATGATDKWASCVTNHQKRSPSLLVGRSVGWLHIKIIGGSQARVKRGYRTLHACNVIPSLNFVKWYLLL